MAGNLLVVHGGGPTAVINASLYGAIRQAQASPQVDRVLTALGGTGGLLNERLRDVTDLPDAVLCGLLSSPSSAIGTSRDALETPEYEAMLSILKKYNIRYVLMNGGNGTMDTCGKLYTRCSDSGIHVIGIPKTMDNDLGHQAFHLTITIPFCHFSSLRIPVTNMIPHKIENCNIF